MRAGRAGARLRHLGARAPAPRQAGRARFGAEGAGEEADRSARSAAGDRELELAEAEARLRKASLKVDVPPELVASKELAKSREDLALARREVAYLKDRLHLEAVEGATEVDALARKRDRAAVRVQEMEDADPPHDRDRAARRHGGLRRHRRRARRRRWGTPCWRGESVIEIPDLRTHGGRRRGRRGRRRPRRRRPAGDLPPRRPSGRRLHRPRARDRRRRAEPVGGRSAQGGQARHRPRPAPIRSACAPACASSARSRSSGPPKALVVPVEAVFNRASGPVVYRKTGWGSEAVRPAARPAQRPPGGDPERPQAGRPGVAPRSGGRSR